MRIRGHHLLCIMNFKGRGYSEEFIENMSLIKRKLEEGEKFLLVIGGDDICSKCPYYKEECQREFKRGETEEKDRKIVEFLGLKEKEEYFYKNVEGIIFEKMKRKDFENFCKNCSWYYLCSKINSLL